VRFISPAAIALALSLSGCLSRAATVAQQTDTSAQAEQLYQQLEGSSWYKVEVLGRTAGYASIESRAFTEAGRYKLRVVERIVLRISMAGESLSAHSELVTTYGPDLRPESYVVSEDQVGRQRDIRATVEGDTIHVVSEAGGQTTEQTLKTGPDFGSELQLSIDILEGGLQVGDIYQMEVFFPDVGGLDQHTITVTEQAPFQVGDETVNAFKLITRSKKLNLDIVSWLDEQGEMIRYEVPGLLGLVMTKVPAAEALAEFSPLKISPAIEVSRRVNNPQALNYVRLRASGQAQPAAQLIPASPRQTVTAQNGEALVEITKAEAPADPPALPIEAPELAEYLASNDMVQSDDTAIVSLAREIAGDETNSWKAAQLLVRWIYENLQKVKSEPRPISALEILDQKSGDCTEHATLAVALARATQVPARMVTGMAWMGDSFYYHAWVEVYVGQWVEMDPTWGEMTVDAGHLRLGDTSLEKVSFIQMALATGRTIGALDTTAGLPGFRAALARSYQCSGGRRHVGWPGGPARCG